MNCTTSLFGRTATTLLLGLGLPLSLLGSAHLLAKSYERVKLADQTIQVKGFAEKSITADLATWNAQVTTRATTQAEAYRALSRDMARVRAYVEKSGVPSGELTIGAVRSSPVYQMTPTGMTTNVIESYTLSQEISLRSNDIERVSLLANQTTSLLEEDSTLPRILRNFLHQDQRPQARDAGRSLARRPRQGRTTRRQQRRTSRLSPLCTAGGVSKLRRRTLPTSPTTAPTTRARSTRASRRW